MEPVEINAGTWYLRSLRADDRISDVPALTLLGVDNPSAYVAATDLGWADETVFVWAVCIPTTGELVALIGVDSARSQLTGLARDGHAEALDAAIAPVTRFAEGALGLSPGLLHNGVPH